MLTLYGILHIDAHNMYLFHTVLGTLPLMEQQSFHLHVIDLSRFKSHNVGLQFLFEGKGACIRLSSFMSSFTGLPLLSILPQ